MLKMGAKPVKIEYCKNERKNRVIFFTKLAIYCSCSLKFIELTGVGVYRHKPHILASSHHQISNFIIENDYKYQQQH